MTLSKLESRSITLEDVQALRPALRQVIVARHLRGLKDREASQELQLPEATLRARLASAYEML